MRVGASVRQHARIKRLHADGMSAHLISKTMQITPQSLEKILAHLDGRDEVELIVEDNPVVQALALENAGLLAKLAEYEGEDPGSDPDSAED